MGTMWDDKVDAYYADRAKLDQGRTIRLVDAHTGQSTEIPMAETVTKPRGMWVVYQRNTSSSGDMRSYSTLVSYRYISFHESELDALRVVNAGSGLKAVFVNSGQKLDDVAK